MSEYFAGRDDDFDAVERAPEIVVTADGVRDYLKNIGRVSLLNAEQEVELARQIEAGVLANGALQSYDEGDDEIFRRLAEDHELTDTELAIDLHTLAAEGDRARQHMVQANLRLVVSIARRYQLSDMEFLDLISEGNTGLLRAVDKFDYTKGFKFSTYATWWIRQSITRAIADKSRTVRMPVHMHEKIVRMSKIQNQMLGDLGRMPTDEELARELEMGVETMRLLQRQSRSPISLDTPIADDTETTVGDLIQDEIGEPSTQMIFNDQLAEVIEAKLSELTERERQVVKLRFGIGGEEPMTLGAIGDCLGLTRERIRQIEQNAFKKLRRDPGKLRPFREELE